MWLSKSTKSSKFKIQRVRNSENIKLFLFFTIKKIINYIYHINDVSAQHKKSRVFWDPTVQNLISKNIILRCLYTLYVGMSYMFYLFTWCKNVRNS